MAKSPQKPMPAKKRVRHDARDASSTGRAKGQSTAVKAPSAKAAPARSPQAKARATGKKRPAAEVRSPRRAAPHVDAPEPARVPKSTKRSAIPPKLGAPPRSPRAARPTPPRKPKRVAPHTDTPAHGPAVPRSQRAAQPDKSGVGAPGLRAGRELSPAGIEPSPGKPELDGAGHVMELHWGDDVPSSRRAGGLVQRWVKRGDALLRHLAEHGAARHEYRADLKDGRFVWVDPEGRVSAEAQAQVLCSWSRSTSSLSMAWADPLVRAVGIARIDSLAAEQDDCDEESAWRVAMQAADLVHAEYLYRVHSPHAWYFLALSKLTFHPERGSFTPSTPVGLVRRGLAETLRAVESRAEPSEVVRQRLTSLGEALLFEAEYAYRGTDWVARLERTGKRLVTLGEQLPRPSYGSVAAGRLAGEWLDRQATIDVSDMLALLEDEWALFT